MRGMRRRSPVAFATLALAAAACGDAPLTAPRAEGRTRDRVAPQVQVYAEPGEYYVGDVMHVELQASDDRAVRWILWEVLPAGDRDSVIVDAPFMLVERDLVVRPEWAGSPQVRLSARDDAGNVSAYAVTPASAITVHGTTRSTTHTSTVAREVRDVAVDTRRGLAYLRTNSSQLGVLDLASMTVRMVPIIVPAPFSSTTSVPDFDLSPSGDSLVVPLVFKGAIGVMDVTQPSLPMTVVPLAGLDSAVHERPVHVRLAANGKVFVTLMADGDPAAYQRLLEVDLRTSASRLRVDAGSGGYVGHAILAASADHGTLVVNGAEGLTQTYDAATDRFGAVRWIDEFDLEPSLDATGARIATGFGIYDRMLQLVTRLPRVDVTNAPRPPTVISRDGAYLYQVAAGRGIVRMRIADGQIVDEMPMTGVPTFLRISPDGSRLVSVEYVSGGPSTVSLIELK